MILPYAHDEMRARRWPVVTIGIAALNLVVFAACFIQERELEPQILDSAGRIETMWRAHRGLRLPSGFASLVGVDDGSTPTFIDGIASPADSGSLPPASGAELQRALDEEGVRFDALVARMPTRRYGYVPAHPSALTAFTSMFMHAGLLHILGNLWFLWLASVSLEDRWGRGVFLAFYLLAGLFATIVHGLTTSAADIPLVGASGAVAGAMGAFLVLFSKARIRFIYWIMYRPGRFTAPAYVMLPLWLTEQVGYAVLFPTGAGVAFGAHVAGFLFGVAAALGLKYSRIDARLDRAIDASVTVGLDERIGSADDAERAGRRDEARGLATAVLADAERKGAEGIPDIVASLRVLYLVDGDQQVFERFVRLASTDDFSLDEAARTAAARMRTRGEDTIAPLPVPLRIRLAKRLEKLGDREAAARIRPPTAPA